MIATDFIRHSAHDKRIRQLQQAFLMQLREVNDPACCPLMFLGNDESELICAETLVA